MIGRSYLYLPGDERPIVSEWNKPPTLQFLQTAVGGYIEAVPGFDTYLPPDVSEEGFEACIAYCDEEGKLKGTPVNETATFLWDQALKRKRPYGIIDPVTRRVSDVLLGPVIILVGSRRFLGEESC